MRCPIFATIAHVISSLEYPWAHALEDPEVHIFGITRARHFVPEAPVGPRPLQDREVPAACREMAEHARKHFSCDLDIALGFKVVD